VVQGTTASSPRLSTPFSPPEPKPERVLIDLTNSPDVRAVKKPGSTKKIPQKTPSVEQKRTFYEEVTTDQFVHAPVDRRQNFVKKVERFPSPPPAVYNKETDNIQSTPGPVKVHNIKVEKLLPTPSQNFRMQYDRDPKSSLRRTAPCFLGDVENGTPNQLRNRVEVGALVCA